MQKYSTPAIVPGGGKDALSPETLPNVQFGSVDVYLASEVDARVAELENTLQSFCDRSVSNNGARCTQCGRWPGHDEIHAEDCPVGKALSLMVRESL